MTSLYPSANDHDVERLNQRSLNTLVRAIERSQGEFSLILARCNYASLRDQITQQLEAASTVPVMQLTLPECSKTLHTEIQHRVREGGEDRENGEGGQDEEGRGDGGEQSNSGSWLLTPGSFACVVFGLESLTSLDQLLVRANQIRDEFPKDFPFPLVLWVNDWVLQKMTRLAPDFKSWATVLEFEMAIADLIDSLRDHTNRLFAKILDVGDEKFPLNWAAAPPANTLRRTELEFALDRITNSGQSLDPALKAGIDFLLGQEAHAQGELETARLCYERSLKFWQSRMGSEQGEGKGQESEGRGQRAEGKGQEPEGGEQAEISPNSSPSSPPSPSSSSSFSPPLPPPIPTDTPPAYPPIPYTLRPAPYTERAACLLVYLGLLWRSNAVLQRAIYETACRYARNYFHQSWELFEYINRQDLVAKFITAEAEVLQKLGLWDELEQLAKKALVLHKLYRDLVRQARDHGFLAEAAIARFHWSQAKHHLEAARRILESAEEILAEQDHPHPHLEASLEIAFRYHYAWYLLLLAKAEAHLGQRSAAIARLEEARDRSYPNNDPLLYIQILETLRHFYYDDQRYLEAFRTKQLQRSLEQQFGFRAFVGALRLEAQQSLAVPSSIDTEALLAQEIAASGRQQDVKRLVDRLERADYKLTVIHGQSGVGKSSIVNAGLVPALKDYLVRDRVALPILVDRYTDWQTALASYLVGIGGAIGDDRGNGEVGGDGDGSEATQAPTPDTRHPTPNTRHLPPLLQTATDQNFLPILIFDQFEEFFFVYETIPERRPFYNFLHDCLNLPYVKVILSLREDYLHYLLEFQRLTDLDIINNDILSKDIRYPLGDFTPEEARSVIKSLTDRAQFYLQDELVDALVTDLAGELGTVRPIELQVVGAEMQAEGITTLAQYRQKGPKEKLVQKSLESVVHDCGIENENVARLVLFLLTNENGTRPLKTRDDLEADLVDLGMTHDIDKLDLVLEVLVGSGLVFFIPELPENRYQLVHDYLVSFIQQNYKIGLAAELEREREQRKRAEEKLNFELAQRLAAEKQLGAELQQRLKTEKQLTETLKNRLRWAILGTLVLAGTTLLTASFLAHI